MSHVKLLLKMVSPQRDDLEFWEVEEIKTETVTRITKLASDAYINQHQKEQHNTKTVRTQGPLVRNDLTEDQALQMTATNVSFI